MPNLNNIDNIKKFKLLQLGESGVGKTTRALSATRFGRVFLFDFDDKLSQLAPKIPEEQRKLIDFETFDTFDQANNRLAELTDEFNKGTNPYSTIIVDTWSRWHDLAIEKQKVLNPRRKKFEFEDWGAVKNYNRQFINDIRSLPCNLIVNTHVGMKESASGDVVLTVSTTGSFGRDLPQYFQETHFMEYDLGKFRVKAMQSSRLVANTGLPVDFYDNKGYLKTNTLEIFDQIAYRKGE